MRPKYFLMTLITWAFFLATVMSAIADPSMIGWTLPGMLAWFIGTIGLNFALRVKPIQTIDDLTAGIRATCI